METLIGFVAGSAIKQVMGGSAGVVLTGVVETIARKAGDALSGPEERNAA